MASQDVESVVQVAVSEYFFGERQEMIIIIATFFAVIVSSLCLLYYSRTSFMIAFAGIVTVFGGMASAGAVSLIVRDRAISAELGTKLAGSARLDRLAVEEERIKVVLSKYQRYRYAAAILALISIGGVAFSQRGWVHGLAAALLLLVVGQMLVDHYSEQRALLYHSRLPQLR